MYAIVQDRTKQYKVTADQQFDIDLRDEKAGDEIILDEVLYLNDGKDIRIGQPVLKNVKVVLEVLGEVKGKKVIVFKFRRRKNYLRKAGHRQRYVRVRVKEIRAS